MNLDSRNEKELISIIMPVYNAEKTLKQSISSIINQEDQNWELLLIDDGSSDMSGSICDEFSSIDRRIKTTHIINRGVSAARNLGMKLSQGEFLSFIDSDDLFDQRVLKKMRESMSDADLVVFGYTFLPSERKRVFHTAKEYESVVELADDFVELDKLNLLNSVWNKCFRKNILTTYGCAFPEDLSMGEDLLFVLSYIKHCKKIKVIDESFYFYNVELANSLSKRLNLNSFEIQKQLKDSTDTVFHNRDNVAKRTGEVFITRVVEDMMRIITSSQLKHREKAEITHRWILDDYFQAVLASLDTKIKQDGFATYLLKYGMPNCFYAYVFVRFELSKVKQTIRRCLRNG